MMYKSSLTVLLVLCLIVICVASFALPALAQGVARPGNSASASRALNLDLGSSRSLLRAGSDAVIQSGSSNVSVKSGDLVTPAQFAAIAQVLSGSNQTLKIDGSGRAVGGSLSLSLFSHSTLSSLSVPANVSLMGAQNLNSLSLAGALINSGTLFAAPSNGGSSFQLNAAFVRNNPGALITSIISGGREVDLSINSLGNLLNLGSITSGGVLNINAGGSIINGAPGTSALMSGVRGTNLSSALGNIVNAGLISSQLGNVTLSTATARDLNINNTLGSIVADLGSVSFSNLTDGVKGNINLTGGLVGGSEILFSSGGTVDAFLNEMRGPVDVSACAAHLAVNAGTLELRNMNLTGDPSFLNTGGDVVLAPNLGTTLSFPGQDVAVLASGDVTVSGGLNLIDLSSAARGGNLFVSAGLSINPVAGGFAIGGPSATGGSVRLQGVAVNTSASDQGAKGGDISILAHDNNLVSEGTFAANDKGFVQIGAIDARSLAGSGGTIHLVAQSDSLVVTDPVLTNYSADRTGRFNVITGEPISNGLIFNTDGTQRSGFFTVDTDSAHALVPIVFNAGVVTSGTTYGDTFVNASGSVTFAPGSFMQSDVAMQILSRKSTIDLGNGSSFIANAGSMGIEADQTVNINTNTTIAGRDNFTIKSLNGSVIGGGGNTMNAAWSRIHVTAVGGDINIGSAGTNNIYALGGIVLEASNDVILPSNNQFSTDTSVLIFAANSINIGSGDFYGGRLNGSPHTGVYAASEIGSNGGIVLFAQSNISNGANLHSAGADIMLATTGGNIQLSSGASINAVAGNIYLLSKGSISGSNNKFFTQAAGLNGNFAGGNMEVSAGFPFTPVTLTVTDDLPANGANAVAILTSIYLDEKNVSKFLKMFPDPAYNGPALDASGVISNPLLFGSNVSIDNTGGDFGRIKSTTAGGTVNLGGSQININKGSFFFDALAPGSNINLQNAQFNSASFKVVPDGGILTKSSVDSLTSAAKAFNLNVDIPRIFTDVTNINVPSERQTRISLFLGRNNKNAGPDNQAMTNAMGLTNRTIFDSRGFQGFDTGRISGISDGGSGAGSGAGATGGAVRVLNVAPMSSAGGSTGTGQVQSLNIMNDVGTAVSPVRVAEQRSDLVLFTTAGQVLTGNLGGSSNATAIGARGTTVSEEKGALLLHGGKLYANSGSTAMKVVTVFGTVHLEPETSAAIEVRADGSGRIVILSSKNKNTPGAKLEHGGELIALAAGEQLRFEPEDMESPHGSDANSAEPTRGTLVREQVPISNLIEKENEGFYSNRSIRLSGNASGAYLRMMDRINKFIDSTESQTSKSNAPASQSLSAAKPKSKIMGEPAHVLAATGTIYQQETEGTLSIKIGSIFIKPDMEQIIRTPLGELKVDAGAGAEIQVKNGQVRFRSYSGPGKIHVLVANKNMLLAPGQELVLQTQKPTRDEALPQDGIARRSLENFELPNGTYGVAGDFSIISAMQAAPHLRPVRVAQKKENSELRANLLKTAASLSIVRAAQGRYYMASQQKSQLPDGAFSDNGEMLESRITYADR